jgi:hypothetical protein
VGFVDDFFAVARGVTNLPAEIPEWVEDFFGKDGLEDREAFLVVDLLGVEKHDIDIAVRVELSTAVTTGSD